MPQKEYLEFFFIKKMKKAGNFLDVHGNNIQRAFH